MERRAPGLRKRGGVWYINYRDQFGRRHEERVGPNYERAVRARAMRLAEVESGRFGLRRRGRVPTLREFVEGPWRTEHAITFKPSTLRAYNVMLDRHVLPAFGDYPLTAITRPALKRFIAEKARQMRASKSRRNPNPDRPCLAPKTVKNLAALVSGVLEVAAADYGLLEHNPLRGILRRTMFPTDANRPRGLRVRVLEPEEFRRAVAELRPLARDMVLVAAFTGLRWGELIALRMEHDIDLRQNKIHVTRAFYRRTPQTPKTAQSVRSVDLCPTVRRILRARPNAGLVFSGDGVTPMGAGNWVKQQWRDAQVRAKVRAPITWHDLRHQFVSLLICAGKHPKYIAMQAGHHSAGFSLDRYGALFETLPITPVEWWDELVWPNGCPYIETSFATALPPQQATLGVTGRESR